MVGPQDTLKKWGVLVGDNEETERAKEQVNKVACPFWWN